MSGTRLNVTQFDSPFRNADPARLLKEVVVTQDTDSSPHRGPQTLTTAVGACYGNGWQQMRKYFLELLAIAILGTLIGIPAGMGDWSLGVVATASTLGLFGFVYSVLVAAPVEYGVSFASLKAARGDKLDIGDMFEAFRNYWNAVLASVLAGAIVVIGLVMLIVPGIIFGCKLAFTPYLVVDRKMEAVDAIRESWRMTNGHAGTVFLIGLLAIPILFAGLLCFGVGIIVSMMWIQMALASLYQSVALSDGTSS